MNDYLKEYPVILNVSEVAEILGVTTNTVRKLIKNDNLHAVKVGKRFKVTKNNLFEYLGENTDL